MPKHRTAQDLLSNFPALLLHSNTLQ